MSDPKTDTQTDPRLPTRIAPTDRLLTAGEFHRLTGVPPEVEWFRNIRNPSTRRAYENAVGDFMRFAGIARPEEFRTVTRAHVIAWRDDLAGRILDGNTRGGATVRHRLAALSSLFEYLCEKNAVTHNPVKASSGPGPRVAKARRPRSATIRPGNCLWRPARAPPPAKRPQGETRPRHPVYAALSRTTARRALQAQGQGLRPGPPRRPAHQGLRQGRENPVFAAASGHERTHPRLSRCRRARRRRERRAVPPGQEQPDTSKNRSNLIANRPLVRLGDAGDRRWRGNPDFLMARSG